MERRPFRPEDLDAIFALHHGAYRGYVEQLWGPWDAQAQRERVADDCVESTCEVLVEGGEIAGYLQYSEEPERVRLWNIVLGPNAQRRGIGTSILGELQERARSRGVPLSLRAFVINFGAQRLYRRLRFREVSRDEQAIEYRYP